MILQPRLPALATAVAALLLSIACGPDPATAPVHVQVDTSASGVVTVSNPAEGAWARSGVSPWRLEEDLRIGAEDGDGPYVFGSIRGVVPDPLGRIWVMDAHALELRVFDHEGVFQFAVGGPGQGPGEFRGNMACVFQGPDGEFWVEDRGYRWHRFDASGGILASHSFMNQNFCETRRWTPDGRFLVRHAVMDSEARTTTSSLVEYRMDGPDGPLPTRTFPVPELPSPRSVTWVGTTGTQQERTIPFVPVPRWVLAGSGDVLVSEGTPTYEIQRRTLDGDTILITRRVFEPVPIPADERRRVIEAWEPETMRPLGRWSPSDAPSHFPPFNFLWSATDGTIWVIRRGAGARTVLDVFDPSGTYLGEVDAPPGFENASIQVITEDEVYGVWRDELRVPYVVRYAIRGRPANHRGAGTGSW